MNYYVLKLLFLIPQLYFQNQAATTIYSEDLEPAYPHQKFYRLINIPFLNLQKDTVRPRYQATLTSANFNSKKHSEVVIAQSATQVSNT